MAVLDLLFCSKGRSTDGAWRRYPLLHPGNTSVGLDIGMAVAVRRCGHVSCTCARQRRESVSIQCIDTTLRWSHMSSSSLPRFVRRSQVNVLEPSI
ncbi:unnamed protein product [Brassica oleracea var. botrytis]|uniref:(rape) hypothetical protein n=2 Tax=Brassica napus TaxID=3708 RepID=A0A816UDN5_BRANA|nr:unnamed protein product [Brassica napus]